MRLVLTFLLFTAFAFSAKAQSIINSNFAYWYDPVNAGRLDLKVANSSDSVFVYYRADTTLFDVAFERRESYGQKNGEVLPVQNKFAGKLKFAAPAKPWLFVVLLTDRKSQVVYIDYRLIEGNYPPDAILLVKGMPVFTPYIPLNTEAVVQHTNGGELKVFHYAEKFPAGSPPFAEREKSVDPIMTVDSTFNIKSGQTIKFTRDGLYLVQSDTNAARGLSFRVAAGAYPKMTKVEDLSTSLVYISTKEEADKLKAAGADKTKFDKVVLDITNNKDRARDLIKYYFRRVEIANSLFTSYKEGWKTDRGMMYLVFGQPDEVSRNGRMEVWTYNNLNAKFTFIRTGSIYDPDYYVMERNRRLSDTWFYTIDMWRKSRIMNDTRN